jgi:hypothetical protein
LKNFFYIDTHYNYLWDYLLMTTNLLGKLAIATTTALALGSFAGAANAQIWTGPFTYTGGEWAGPLETTEITQWVNFPGFDPNIMPGTPGTISTNTLTGVTLTLSGHSVQSFTGFNKATQSQTAVLESTVDLYFSIKDKDGNVVDGILGDAGFPVFSQTSSSGLQTYAPGETKEFGPNTLWDDEAFTFDSDSAFLSLFTSSGFTVDCFSLSGFNVSGGGGNIDTTQDTQAYCDAKVEYTYTHHETPVTSTPEPATILGLVSFAGAGILSRRRKS